VGFEITVPQHILDSSLRCAQAGSMGHRQDGSDGTAEQQLTGIIGQNMIHLSLGKPLIEPNTGFDGGVDFEVFNLKCDVKTMGRSVQPKLSYVNNLLASQIHFQVDAYLFLSLNKTANLLTVCGWLPKASFLERATLYEAGATRLRSDGSSLEIKFKMYEIINNDLFLKFNSWSDLMAELYLFAQMEGKI